MDWQALITAITTVGFPIVCCGVLFSVIDKERDSHKEEIAELRSAVENNTVAMTKLVERLGGSEK